MYGIGKTNKNEYFYRFETVISSIAATAINRKGINIWCPLVTK